MTPEAIEQLIERSRQLQAEHAAFSADEEPITRLLELFDDIRLAFIAADKMALKRSVGWFGRLLGRDIELQAEAELLRAQGPLLVHRADALAVRWQAYAKALDAFDASITAMQGELDQAAADTELADDTRHRLQQLAMLFETTYLHQIAKTTLVKNLGRRFNDIRAGLLPMLAQTGIVDAAHRNSELYARASTTLAALETADTPAPPLNEDSP